MPQWLPCLDERAPDNVDIPWLGGTRQSVHKQYGRRSGIFHRSESFP
jgi:hypothetical protein